MDAWGLNNPAISINIKDADRSSHTLLIGKARETEKNISARDQAVYAKSLETKTVYLIPLDAIGAIVPDYLHFKNRILETFPLLTNVSDFSIKNLQTEQVAWTFNSQNPTPANLSVKQITAQKTLIEALKAPRARNYLHDNPQTTDKNKWIWELTANLASPNDTHPVQRTYRFNKRFGFHQTAICNELHTIFTLEREWTEALTELTFQKEHKLSPEDIIKKATPPEEKE